MKVYVTDVFRKSTKKQKVTNRMLGDFAVEVRKGNVGDELEENLFKKRMKGRGVGKSGGYRTYYAYRVGSDLFLILNQERKAANRKGKQSSGQKSSLSQNKNKITDRQLEAMAEYGRGFLNMSEKKIEQLLKEGVLEEIILPE